MRKKRVAGDRRLDDALADLASALNASKIPWMVIGGIAIIARGVRRMTTDIDVTIRGDQVRDLSSLLRLLAGKRLVPRIDNVERFARESLVLLLRHEPTGVDIDVSMAWTEFEHEAIASATQTTFGSIRAPMSLPQDLIVFKAIAGRAKDVEDMTSLLALYPDLDHARLRKRVNQLAALAEEPGLADGLESAIATATGKKRGSSRVSKPRPRSRRRS